MSLSDRAAQRADAAFDTTVARLSEYLTYPAISCQPESAEDVHRLAQRVRDDLESIGMQNCEVICLENALPSVIAEWMGAGPGKPTILVYGHLDIQPVNPEKWIGNPHVARIEGDRLYARGAADDMGGWVSHLGAIQAWFEEAGELPCNIKLFIEGEEEIGSPNLERYMDAYPRAFEADVMILTDCDNPSPEIPGLTVSLRGVTELEIHCESLASDVHSGLWGNVVPDPAIGLMQLITRLVDEDGRLNIGRQEIDEAWRADSQDVLPAELIRKGARLIDGVDPLPGRGRSAAEWGWRQPSVTVLSTSLPSTGEEKNAVRAQASACLSFRIAPGQTAEDLLTQVRQVLLTNPPGGLKVTLKSADNAGESWLYHPKGEAFAAADRAYTKIWGRKLTRIGVGGSIPFVALFGRRFSKLPLILNGVMDSETGAHGPDESMHLGIFKKTILTNVYLFEELGALPARR